MSAAAMTAMSEPCLSSSAYDLLVVAIIVAGTGLYLVCQGAALLLKAARKLRLAKLGQDLLRACANDWVSAEKAIGNFEFENALLDDMLRRYMTPRQKFARWDDLA